MNFIKAILRLIRTIILSVILICLIVFMVNNRDAVTITLHPFPFDVDTRMFLVMLIFFLLGMFFGMLACSKSLIKRFIEKFKDSRKIKKLEKEIAKN